MEISSLNSDQITDAVFPVFRTTARNRHFRDRETWRCLGWHKVETVSYLKPNSEALIKMLAAKWNDKPRYQSGWEDALRKKWAVLTISVVQDMIHDNPMKDFVPGPKLNAAEMLAILKLQGAKRNQEIDTHHKNDGAIQQSGRCLTLGDHLSTRTRTGTFEQGEDLLIDFSLNEAEDAKKTLESTVPQDPGSSSWSLPPPAPLSQGKDATKQGADPVLIPDRIDPHEHTAMASRIFREHFEVSFDNSSGMHNRDVPSKLSGSDPMYSREDLVQAFGPLRSKLQDLNATRAEPNRLAFILVIEPFATNRERFDLLVSSNLQLVFLPPPSSITQMNPTIDAYMHYGGSVLADLVVPVFRVPENMPRRGRSHGPWYYCGFYQVLGVTYPRQDDDNLIHAIERKYSVELKNTKRHPRKGYAVVKIERRERSASASPMKGINPMTATALADIIAGYESAAAAIAEQRSARMAMKANERSHSVTSQNQRARATRSPSTAFGPVSQGGNQYGHSISEYEVKPVDLQSTGLQLEHDSEASEDEQGQVDDQQSTLHHLNVPTPIGHGEKPSQPSQPLISFDEIDEEPIATAPLVPTVKHSPAADSLAILMVPSGQTVEPEEDLVDFKEWELAKENALNPRTPAEEEKDEKSAVGGVKKKEWPRGSLHNLPQIQHHHPRRFVKKENPEDKKSENKNSEDKKPEDKK